MAFNIQHHKEVTQVETKQDSALGIMRWGQNNAFPQTLKNLIEQSPTAKPAVERTAKFYKGAGFEGEDEIVSNYGLTLKKVVDIMADDLATFGAYALQLNYNIKGQVIGINPMRVAELRFNEFDELNFASKLGYHPDFAGISTVKKNIPRIPTRGSIKWFDRFNPLAVIKQIQETEGKIANYKGQILYHSTTGHSSYPIPTLQAPINYLLADIENSILVRKETATGFINTYLLKTTMDAEDSDLIALEDAIHQAQGARGSGKVITFAGLTPEDVSSTLLEEIGGGGAGSKAIIESAKLSYEMIQKIIFGAYLIPPILGGADQQNGFSGTDLEDAYFVFNAVTQDGRNEIEQGINRVLRESVFKTREIKIKKLTLDTDEEKVTGEAGDIVEDAESVVKTNEMLTNLTGKQFQALQRIVKRFNKGELTKDQAGMMLKQSFGFDDDDVNVWLVEDNEKSEENV